MTTQLLAVCILFLSTVCIDCRVLCPFGSDDNNEAGFFDCSQNIMTSSPVPEEIDSGEREDYGLMKVGRFGLYWAAINEPKERKRWPVWNRPRCEKKHVRGGVKMCCLTRQTHPRTGISTSHWSCV